MKRAIALAGILACSPAPRWQVVPASATSAYLVDTATGETWFIHGNRKLLVHEGAASVAADREMNKPE